MVPELRLDRQTDRDYNFIYKLSAIAGQTAGSNGLKFVEETHGVTYAKKIQILFISIFFTPASNPLFFIFTIHELQNHEMSYL